MKKSYMYLIIFSVITLFVNCEEVIDNGSNKKTIKTITAVPGLLIHQLTVDEMQTLTELRLEGSIDYRDFEVFRSFMPNLEYLDMSDLTIKEYEGNSQSFNCSYENGIPNNAFYTPHKKNTTLKTIILPKLLYFIGKYAFAHCTKLNTVTIPSSVRFVFKSSFYSTERFNSHPDGLVYFDNVLMGSKNLGSQIDTIKIKSGTRVIACGAFDEYDTYNSVLFPNTIKYIGKDAFKGCKNITSIDLPNSLEGIYGGAFYGSNLKLISINRMIPPEMLDEFGDGYTGYETFSNYNTAILRVPKGALNTYRSSESFMYRCNWDCFKNIVEVDFN